MKKQPFYAGWNLPGQAPGLLVAFDSPEDGCAFIQCLLYAERENFAEGSESEREITNAISLLDYKNGDTFNLQVLDCVYWVDQWHGGAR